MSKSNFFAFRLTKNFALGFLIIIVSIIAVWAYIAVPGILDRRSISDSYGHIALPAYLTLVSAFYVNRGVDVSGKYWHYQYKSSLSKSGTLGGLEQTLQSDGYSIIHSSEGFASDTAVNWNSANSFSAIDKRDKIKLGITSEHQIRQSNIYEIINDNDPRHDLPPQTVDIYASKS